MKRVFQGLALVAVLSLVACSGSCGRGSGGRVLLLGMDGMDPRTVDLLISEGKLPNFAKLRREGAYGRITAAPPLLSPVLWTTVATGRSPEAHGIGAFVATKTGTGESLPVTSDMRKTKALWNILSDQKRKVAVVGWWATWPAEKVNGSIVSDHACYHFLFEQGQAGPKDTANLTFPPEQFDSIKSLIRRPTDVTMQEAAPFIKVTPEEFGRPFSFDDDVAHFKWALATADSYRRIGLKLWKEQKPDVLLSYTEGTDSVAHLFGHLFRTPGLAGELLAQQQKFGSAVGQMYVYADSILGDHLASMDSDTTLIVMSDHGFQLGTIQEDPSIATGSMRRVSERFHRPEGLLYLYGRGVKPRARIEQARLIDIAPTVLALTGLAPASDLPGKVLQQALDLKAGSPVASYEKGGAASKAPAGDAGADPQILERLRSLGYIGDTPAPGGAAPVPGARSASGERNIAALHFQARRYDEAERIYRRLVRETPTDAGLHVSLAGVLGVRKQYDEAMKELDQALKLDSLSPEAYHNRAVIQERRNNTRAAIADYRRALKASPSFEPARGALRRLTGSDEAFTLRSDAERRAFAIAQEAADLARRGDYPGAQAKLSEAERLAPTLPVVYQYQANVAYLKGDREGARRALEKAVQLDPENPLFRANLERLKRGRGGRR